MKIFSILTVLTHSIYAHETNDPNHHLTSPHHGSPLLWILSAIAVSAFMYQLIKSKK